MRYNTSLRTSRQQAGLWLAGGCSGLLITDLPTNHSQVACTCCRTNTGQRAPRCLPMRVGRSRAVYQSTSGHMFHRLTPTVARRWREVQDVVSTTRLSAAPALFFFFQCSSAAFLFLSLSLIRSASCNVCMLFCMKQMLWPLLEDPLYTHVCIHIPGLRCASV